MVHVAVPEVTVAPVQPVIAMPFDVNVTVPLGAKGEFGAVSVAVKVTDCPEVDGFGDPVTAVVLLALLTVCARDALVLPLKFASPLYVTTIVWLPAVMAESAHVATPPVIARDVQPVIGLPLSVKDKVPVGGTAPFAGATVPVKVTL